METNRNKNQSEKDQENRLHNPQGKTSPAAIKSGDKLRENPSNDEETISQQPEKHVGDRSSQSPITKEHDSGRSQVTNQGDQKQTVNDSGGDWDKPEEEGNPTPQKNPYEEISDDPNETQKKIPKM